jgi:hypothetical protein
MKRMPKVFVPVVIAAFLMGAFAADARPPQDPCYNCYVLYQRCVASSDVPDSCEYMYARCLEQAGGCFISAD